MSLHPITHAQPRIHNIAALYKVNIPSITAFQFRFRDVHAYNMAASAVMSVQNDPFKEMYRRRWAARTQPLWVTFAAGKTQGPMSKSVVRIWVVRRLKTAFKESLRKRGYNYDGSRMEGVEGKDIFGTVLLQPQEATVRTKYLDLIGQTDLAVEYIIKHKTPARKENGSANGYRFEKAKTHNANGEKQHRASGKRRERLV